MKPQPNTNNQLSEEALEMLAAKSVAEEDIKKEMILVDEEGELSLEDNYNNNF